MQGVAQVSLGYLPWLLEAPPHTFVQVTEHMKACKHEETDCQLAQQLSHQLNLPYAEVWPPEFRVRLMASLLGLVVDDGSIWHLLSAILTGGTQQD